MTRCKFKCDTVLSNKDGSTIELYPVFTGSAENEEFFKYTPFGSLKMGIVNPEAAKQFVPGKEYYIDITEV